MNSTILTFCCADPPTSETSQETKHNKETLIIYPLDASRRLVAFITINNCVSEFNSITFRGAVGYNYSKKKV